MLLEEAGEVDVHVNVVVGAMGDPDTWERVGVERAALVVSTANDFQNTNVAFTVRGLAEELPIVTSASQEDSVDVMKLAGSSFVLRLEEMIGGSFSSPTMSAA